MSISKNYILNLITIATGILFPIITFPYISRVLMPEYLGKITFAQSIVFYFITISLLGIPIYGVRELSKEKNDINKFREKLTELFLIGIIGSLVSFVIYYLFINNIKELKSIKSVLQLFSIQVLFSFLNLDYVFIVLEKHKRRAVRSLIIRGISIVLIIFLVKTYEDYLIYVLILVIPEIIMRILDFFTIKKYLNFKNKINLKRHMKSLFILFISSISVSLYVNLDSTMIGLMLGNSSVGIYTSASKMTKILIPLIVALETVIAPELIYSIKENNIKKIFEKINIFVNFNFIVGIQLIFILFILSKEIILLFSGTNFIQGIGVMEIMLPVIFFIPVGSFMSGKILISHNLEKLSLRFNLIGMIINLVLNYILILKYGILGAAIATMSSEGIVCILKTLRVKKIYPTFNLFTLNRLKYLVIGLFITLFLLQIKTKIILQNELINIVIFGGLYVMFYISILTLSKDKIILILFSKVRQYRYKIKKEKVYEKSN